MTDHSPYTLPHRDLARRITREIASTPEARRTGMDAQQIATLVTTLLPLILPLLKGGNADAILKAIPVLLPLILAALPKKQDPAVTPPTPTPTPDVVPTPPPPTPPAADGRHIAALAVHYLGAEGWSQERGHYPVGLNGLLAGEPAGRRYRLHLDVTPSDQNGLPFFNDDLPRYPALFAKDPSRVAIDPRNGHWSCGEGNNRIEHYLRVGNDEYGPQGDLTPGTPWSGQSAIGLSSEYDDAAMTPVLVVSDDVPLGVPFTVSYRAAWVGPDGARVESGWTKPITVNAWGD